MCIRYVPVGTSSYETKHKTMRFRAKRCLPRAGSAGGLRLRALLVSL